MIRFREKLAGTAVARDTEAQALMLGLLAGEHVVFIGPPGTAKSMLVENMTDALKGASIFKQLMSKFTTPEQVFGPVKVSGLMDDKFEREVSGRAADCHIFFADEVFKSSDVMLNGMLTLLNERKFDNGGIRCDTPLMMAVGASNELPENDTLAALWDRFLIRVHVDYIGDDTVMASYLRDFNPAKKMKPLLKARISIAEVKKAQVQIKNMPVPDRVVDMLVMLRNKLKRVAIPVSDRRMRKCLRILQAAAYLRGREKVAASDIHSLVNVLWDKPEQRETIDEQVVTVINPHGIELVEIRREMVELMDGIKTIEDETEAVTRRTEAFAQCRQYLSRLDTIIRMAKADGQDDHEHMRDVHNELYERFNVEIAEPCLGQNLPRNS